MINMIREFLRKLRTPKNSGYVRPPLNLDPSKEVQILLDNKEYIIKQDGFVRVTCGSRSWELTTKRLMNILHNHNEDVGDREFFRMTMGNGKTLGSVDENYLQKLDIISNILLFIFGIISVIAVSIAGLSTLWMRLK